MKLCVIIGVVITLAATSRSVLGAADLHAEPKDQFLHLDLDADDTLSKQELSSGGYQIKDIDRNKDDQVDLEEFLAYRTPIVEAAHAEEDFVSADQNKDGYLSVDEYAEAGHAQSTDETLLVVTRGRFADLDQNKDGKVSKSEYVLIQGRDPFKSMDLDGNEQLSSVEWQAHLKKNSLTSGTKKVDPEAFRLMDTDGGGWLSRSEFSRAGSILHEAPTMR